MHLRVLFAKSEENFRKLSRAVCTETFLRTYLSRGNVLATRRSTSKTAKHGLGQEAGRLASDPTCKSGSGQKR